MSGIEPKIESASFGTYGAHLLSYEIGACKYSNGYVLPPTSMIPVKLKHTLGLRSVVLNIDFEGDTPYEIEQNISEFTEILHNGADILLPDGYSYSCVFKKTSAPKEKAPWIRQVKFTLEGYRHGAIESKTLTETGSIFVDGNYPTPAILKITTSATSATVCGITISNIDGVIEIDGYKKKVTQTKNGVVTNKFADTNMTEFPKLEAGYHEIAISASAAISVEVSYYPLYR